MDLLHHFPRVEYSVTQRAFQLWYYREEAENHDTYETIKILFVFFNLTLIASLFVWGTSYNYILLDYIVRFSSQAKVTFYFAYKQVIHETLVMIIAGVVIILSLVYSQTGRSSSSMHAPWTPVESRRTLFIGFLVYYCSVLFLILLLYTEPIFLAMRYYFPRVYKYVIAKYAIGKRRRPAIIPCVVRESPVLEPVVPIGCLVPIPLPYAAVFSNIQDRKLADEIHLEVVSLYHDPIVKLPVVTTIVRNLAYISSLLLTLALLFNFYTPLNNVYLLFITGFSFAYIYYQVKYMAIAIFYLSLFHHCSTPTEPCNRKRNLWLIAFILGETILLIVYIAYAYHSIYLTYFNSVNSTHSQTIGVVYIVGSITLTMLAAIFMVSNTFDKYVDPLIECAIEERKLR